MLIVGDPVPDNIELCVPPPRCSPLPRTGRRRSGKIALASILRRLEKGRPLVLNFGSCT
jgi:hypothetical protein